MVIQLVVFEAGGVGALAAAFVVARALAVVRRVEDSLVVVRPS